MRKKLSHLLFSNRANLIISYFCKPKNGRSFKKKNIEF